ncbi:MAG TPA: phage major capsid protein, partial [Acidovorax sp.]|nr:phage major capsid protein [Acidovorax sp.]
MQLHAIREQRAAKVQEARALLASAPTLTPEQQAKFDTIKGEITSLEGQEQRAQLVEDWERRS